MEDDVDGEFSVLNGASIPSILPSELSCQAKRAGI